MFIWSRCIFGFESIFFFFLNCLINLPLISCCSDIQLSLIISDISNLCYRYLLEHGADVSAINCDQELAIDIAESDDMRQLLEQHLRDIGTYE